MRPGMCRGCNVLLITIDTLRLDRVGAFGGPFGLTPTLDRLAAGGVRYTRAFSHVPMTLPAHATILTGLIPPRHGIRNNTSVRLDEKTPTLASVLRRAGYRTGAFVGAVVLDGRFGLDRGFDEYDDRLPRGDRATFRFLERKAADVLNPAGTWIVGRDGHKPEPQSETPTPWFAWVHLFDPHAPYDAPPEYRPGRQPYDAEVAYVDAMLGRFFDRLRAAHALDGTVIVVTADHGESLGEHGESTHGLFAYNATIAVPLIVSGPSLGPEIVDTPVAHADLVPTILDLVGATPLEHLDGRSLVQSPSADRRIYIEALDASLTRGWAPLHAIVHNGWKYIDLPEPELYDLSSDPHEIRNRAGGDGRTEALRRLLFDLRPPSDATAPPAGLDADAAARLRSLGYVGTAAPRRGPPTAADDPKRLVALNERFNSALTAFDEGRADEALAAFASILQARPDFLVARTSAATLLLSRGRSAEAVRLLSAAPADQANAADLLAKLGSALRAAGDHRGAADAFRRARDAGDQNPDLLSDLAVEYAALGRTADARTAFREVLARNPRSATAWYNLGLFELQSRRPTEAADALRHAVDADAAYADAWQALGAALLATDKPAAIDAWRRAERLRPADYDLLFNLGVLLAGTDQPGEAVPYLERFAREAPPNRYAGDIARVRAILARVARPS
jgi:choline-sulfatase